jgi:hypothetical protein
VSRRANPEIVRQVELNAERERLELDKAAAKRDRNFFNRNTGMLVSAAVSFTATSHDQP